MRFSVMDQGQFRAAKTPDHVNGRRFADDMILMFTHGATHIDALGHFWRGDFIYNGWSADSTTGGMDHADAAALANRGIVGRGVLVDVARDRGVDQLPDSAAVSLEDLLEVARHQGVSIEPHDVLLIRTGWLGQAQRLAKQYAPSESELKQPGLRYSPALVDWFYQMEIPLLATDTITNECWVSVEDPLTLELHIGLMSNLGVLFCELTALDKLAADCAADGQYDFLYAAAPLNILCATAGPANPIVVK
jgi:kynurenine formamidase